MLAAIVEIYWNFLEVGTILGLEAQGVWFCRVEVEKIEHVGLITFQKVIGHNVKISLFILDQLCFLYILDKYSYNIK